MDDVKTLIANTRKELTKYQQLFRFYNQQARKYGKHSPDESQAYKVMATQLLAHVRILKDSIQKLVTLEKRISLKKS